MDSGMIVIVFLSTLLVGSWIGWAYTFGKACFALETLYLENSNLIGRENLLKNAAEQAKKRAAVLEERLVSIRVITGEIEE